MKNTIIFTIYVILIILAGYLMATSLVVTIGAFLLFPLLWILLGFGSAFLISLSGLAIFIILLFIFVYILEKIS